MTPALRRSVVLLLGLGLLAGCSRYGEDIDKVKAATTTGATNAELVKELAGARGTFEWSAREATKYAADGEIVLVEAVVTKTNRAGKTQVVQLQWLHNRETGKVAFEDVLVDGQSRGILGAALEILKQELN